MTAEERKALNSRVAAECKTKLGISDDEMKEIMEGEATESGKCLHSCIHEKLGLVRSTCR